MKKIICFLFAFTSVCHSSMFYLNTPYGVLLIDIENGGKITSIIYENNQLRFTNSTVLQLVVTHDPACPSLAVLLASFLSVNHQGESQDLFSMHGEGSLLEANFISYANNYDYEIMTETYSPNDSVNCLTNGYVIPPPYATKPFPCMFNCPSGFKTPQQRINHYKASHHSPYETLKQKYSKQTTCPLCGFIIISFLSFSKHINLDHYGKGYSDF
ncbi:hypothetical protein [Endozoicomonas numazuensis]|uniref:hypothetical protein n=1 Tax=Endozoicomonas numazuensis TaxID=1137799 RepID=UPI000AC5071C|nr:hypothetical protein [Endozoicomonas numazuensis]